MADVEDDELNTDTILRCGGEVVTLLPPWELTSGGSEQQLARETAPMHDLYGVHARSIARRGDCDDVLFVLISAPKPYAVVHLTWSPTAETSGQWPGTTFFNSLEDWRFHCWNKQTNE